MKPTLQGLSLTRGALRLRYSTAFLIAACLFSGGFTIATWITALIRS